MLCSRQADVRQRTGECETVQQAERERDEPGMASGETCPAAIRSHQLDSNEYDAERDQRFDHWRADIHVTERRRSQRDAVRDGERGDGLAAACARPRTSSSSPSTKLRVIEPRENVFDAQKQIGRHGQLAGALQDEK